MATNHLYYGDNLEVLRERIADDSVDLVYLDPPFNSNRAYNVLFRQRGGEEAQAQIEAFDDTWSWSPEVGQQYQAMVSGGAPSGVADALEAMHRLLGENDLLAYLVMMAPRLVQLHRVLNATGSLYLHCDPTASHYLKIMLDAVFGPERFVNEVIWRRTSAHNRLVRYGPVHDVILFYAKGERWYWQEQHMPYDPDYVEQFYHHVEEGTGRRYRLSDVTSNRPGGRYLWHGNPPPGNRYWGYGENTMERFEQEGRLIYSRTGIPSYKRYLDEMPGQLLQDVWTDVRPVGSNSRERLGYQTQKPVALLERIIEASCPPEGTVLDPFCGCGTTVAAAQGLGRRWIGIDVTYLAIDLIDTRLRGHYGNDVAGTYEIVGIPRDLEGAQALFSRSPFEFERWAVSLVDGTPNERQVGDLGIDGVVRFPTGTNSVGRALVSVKGGRVVSPTALRDLVGTVGTQNAEIGILITLVPPTRGLLDAARHAGSYAWPVNERSYPKVQVLTVEKLLAGQRPEMPTPFLPYIQARRLAPEPPSLF